jgi:hypothetical protein
LVNDLVHTALSFTHPKAQTQQPFVAGLERPKDLFNAISHAANCAQSSCQLIAWQLAQSALREDRFSAYFTAHSARRCCRQSLQERTAAVGAERRTRGGEALHRAIAPFAGSLRDAPLPMRKNFLLQMVNRDRGGGPVRGRHCRLWRLAYFPLRMRLRNR